MSDSILMNDKAFKRGCSMQFRSRFFIILSFENDRSPVQFVGITDKHIRNAISIFENVDSTEVCMLLVTEVGLQQHCRNSCMYAFSD